jgi:hypothetical protein
MKRVFKKLIKEDKGTKPVQMTATICNENKITFGGSSGKDSIVFDLSYNQLLSLKNFINKVICEHYEEFESKMEQEKTQAIYIDDPVNW